MKLSWGIGTIRLPTGHRQSAETASLGENLPFLHVLEGHPPQPFSKGPLQKESWALYPRQGLGPCSALHFFLESVLQMHFCYLGKSKFRAAQEPVDSPG